MSDYHTILIHQGSCDGPILIETATGTVGGRHGCNEFTSPLVEPVYLLCDGWRVQAVHGTRDGGDPCAPTPVPEPSLALVLVLGAVAVTAIRRLKRTQRRGDD